jgi:hypothetical protein
VKIGITKTSAQRRVASLNGAGTVDDLEIAAVFCSMHPSVDEKKIHDKLARYKYNREYFQLDPANAISRIATILRREPYDVNDRLKRYYQRLRKINKAKAANRFQRGEAQPDGQLCLRM